MISQFFVLSQRGDNIVFRDYRGEIQKGSAEIFFRKVKFWKGEESEEAPPIFNLDGVNYIHVKVAGLLFVATTGINVSPSLVLELLQRIARVIKDYLGVLNEDSLRKNFVLVYELLDEVIDFGYPQTTSTELLKSYVFNEPLVIDAARLPALGPAAMFMQGAKKMPGTAVTKSVIEIFVDVIEKISVTFSSSLSYREPEIRLALNEDLSIGRNGSSIYGYSSSTGGGMVILDDCNFHESVQLDSFEVDRKLTLNSVMNYRMTQEFKPPFAEVILKVRADFPSNITANTIMVQMPLPAYTTSFELEPGTVGNTTDFRKNEETGMGFEKANSQHEVRNVAALMFPLNSHINFGSGPVNMTFTIQCKVLEIAKKSKTYNPYRGCGM
ncbi:unnamed protein product [Spirodela intermedia]|uniref:MHD domain-containing protein n=1 Tax=Spirodela intermedia TaxID=51605 RepID=A0A7I8IRA8_SPIIN|nr:unnamed protein product [Spirodela intermedia]CAA6659481.1 unnamed protein product [Spirodela intermedia]